ncbi:piggyBac transposable element-derived protein 4 [Trichonephila clavipes]|nr:piggyBac transposable element-derived protein 4 [Trichonephila clavipes]
MWQVNKRNRGLDQLIFRIALAPPLTDGYSSRKRKEHPANFKAKKCVVLHNVRLASVRNHILNIFSSYRRCRKCSRNGLEKRTRSMNMNALQNVMSPCALQEASHLFMATK